MGEAKQRRAAQQAWLNDLSEEERKIVEVCRQLHARLNKQAGFVQACYFYAFFLRKYLREEHGIAVTPIVGWANIGRNLFGHAWVEHTNKMIDLSLTRTNNPVAIPAGQLLVLDYPLIEGATYTYTKETSSEIAKAVGADRVTMSESMRTIGEDDTRIDEYFLDAPPQYQYEAVAALLRQSS